MREVKHLCDSCKRDISDGLRYEVCVYVYSSGEGIQVKQPRDADLCGMCVETLLPALRGEE
jgi:hypothetical protein